MAATNVLTVGSTAAASSDIVVASGESVVLGLKGIVTLSARAAIELKDDLGSWNAMGELGSSPLVLYGPATYRVRREAGETLGVFRG